MKTVAQRHAKRAMRKYNEEQARDEHGRFGEGGGGPTSPTDRGGQVSRVDAAREMYGAGSPQHVAAQARWGSTAGLSTGDSRGTDHASVVQARQEKDMISGAIKAEMGGHVAESAKVTGPHEDDKGEHYRVRTSDTGPAAKANNDVMAQALRSQGLNAESRGSHVRVYTG
jgi:hypothetical protein